MDQFSSYTLIKTKTKYHLAFMQHCSNKGHIVTGEDLRLRETLLHNYYKSLFLSNLFAFYINYIRKNKSFVKTVLTHFLFTSFGLIFAFRSNERFFHLDSIFKQIDPNIIVNSRDLSNEHRNNIKFKIFQALILNELDEEEEENKL